MLLMDDADKSVRNWATFVLGAQCDEDSAEVRTALRKRLDDALADARQEASEV